MVPLREMLATRASEFVLRALGDLSGAVCVGSLVFAVFFASETCGRLTARARDHVRRAGLAALLWGCAELSWAFSSGLLTGDVLSGTSGGGESAETVAAMITAVLALVLAIACRGVRGWRTTSLLTGVALFGLLPTAVARRSGDSPGHDVGTNAIVLHVTSAAVWLGVLLALGLHLWRTEERARLLLTRYRWLAAGCWTLLAVSGTADLLVAAREYGAGGAGHVAVVLGKIGCLVAVAVLGVLVRRRVTLLAPGDAGARRRAVTRLLGAELTLLVAGFTLSELMVASALPPNGSESTASEAVLGYDLAAPPTLWNLLLGWRFDLLFGTCAVVCVAVYLLGVRRLRRRGDAWPAGRTAAWLSGWGCVLFVTSSGVGVYAGGVFSLHMFAHMVLNMLAPVLLVLGGPVTLALRALPASGRGQAAGVREWLLAWLHSPLTGFLAGPGVATALFVSSFYALYFTDLFELGMFEYWGHQLMKAHFLLVGWLYYWTVIGVDPAPRPLPHVARLGVVLAVMPFHAFFGIITMSLSNPLAEDFYRALELPWPRDLLEDQFLGGGIAWAMGEVPLVLVLLALLTQWYRYDTRSARRADRDGDEDLAAYNAMLAELARSRGG
ncbi:cytochrome c oxidase assembly protein [Actinopolyspora halophila]|uniref:cytochrome c oxidase assembly protein n=1 Tax=Actinopolyspora halophila TaxID=1850 RepID=UPI001FE0CED0|nr:cytochrome c oxidase assembly protein [Actinopolyspora halophila]